MMLTLIRRELLDNLMTFRFAAAVFITLLLVVANTIVLIKDYERRLASYNIEIERSRHYLEEGKTYSVAQMTVDRPPNPLSIFNAGLDKRLGNEIWIHYGYVPTLWDADKHVSENPFMNILSSIDIVFIFEGVLSLLALIFAYNTLAGEYESGTLRLVLTHSVSRGYILLAKYISAMACLLVPMLMSLLLAMLLLTTSVSFSLSMHDFLRIGGIIFASIAYLSVFYLTGMLISAITRRTSTALMLSMFVWGFLVLVYPNMIVAVIQPSNPPEERRASAHNHIKQIWEEFERARKHFLATDPHLDGNPYGNMRWRGGYNFEHFQDKASILQYYYDTGAEIDGFHEASESKVLHVQNYHRFLVPLIIDTAERTWHVRKPVLKEAFVLPATIDRAWLRLSPTGIYDIATQAFAGTDLNGMQDFFTAIQQYRQSVIDYYYDKNAFGSRQWFSTDKGVVDWSTLPQFSFQRSDISINVQRALPDLFLLLTINVVLFIAIFLVFVRREV